MERKTTNTKIKEKGNTAKWKFTDETIRKLEEAFAMDCTVEEASFYADISTQTYYTWIKENDDLKKRFDALRNKPVLKARKKVVDELDKSYSNAMDYLSRKKKLEFSQRVEKDLTTNGESLNLGAMYSAIQGDEEE